MKTGAIIFILAQLLAMSLIAYGLFSLAVPLIPFGPIGLILVGLAILLVITLLGGKTLLK